MESVVLALIRDLPEDLLLKVVPRLARRNLGVGAEPRYQRAEIVGRLESCQRHGRSDRAPIMVRGKHRVLEDAGNAARHHMGAAQVGFGKGRQDRAVLLLTCEIDVAYQSA